METGPMEGGKMWASARCGEAEAPQLYRWGSKGPERGRDLPTVTQPCLPSPGWAFLQVRAVKFITDLVGLHSVLLGEVDGQCVSGPGCPSGISRPPPRATWNLPFFLEGERGQVFSYEWRGRGQKPTLAQTSQLNMFRSRRRNRQTDRIPASPWPRPSCLSSS